MQKVINLQEVTLLVKNKLDRSELLELLLNDSGSQKPNDEKFEILDYKVAEGVKVLPDSILAFNEFKVISSIAYETVCKFMDGLCRAFTISNSIIEPDLYVSVIGVGSVGESVSAPLQSQTHVKTLLYNQHVVKEKIMDLAEIIYLSLIRFENESISRNTIDMPSASHQEDLTDCDISMLDIGVSFLELMKRDCALSSMALITDGVSLDLFLSSDSTNRAIVRELINICIVQTGSGSGYSPNSNFGHIPNNEDLRFLALRADGSFLYAEDCPYVTEDDSSPSEDPNLYHYWAAMKKFSFSDLCHTQYLIGAKPRPVDEIRSRFINTTTTTIAKQTGERLQELSFPWLSDSSSPYIAEILCNYRNFKLLNVSVDAVLKMRTNEGFVLSKISRIESQAKKQHRLEMVFALPLAPHVKIIYTIKFTVPNPQNTNLLGFIPPKGIRVDVNVLAHHSFAILFINVHNLEASKADSISSALYNKLVRLHSMLTSISEADETLQILYQFNSTSALYLANQAITSAQFASPSSMELPSNYWNFLNQAVLAKPWLLDTFKIVILLRSTSTQSNMGARALAALIQPGNSSLAESPRTRYQVSTIYLSRLLTSWASISLSKTSHLAFVFEDGMESAPTGFCILQVIWETESLMSLNLRFFSTSDKERKRIGVEFQKEVSALRHVNRHDPDIQIRPLHVCKKPIDSIIIYYTPLEDPERKSRGDSISDYFVPNKSLARTFLHHKSWIWFRDINRETVPPKTITVLVESAFVLLYNTRVSEEFSRAAEAPGLVTFYKEVEFDGRVFAYQYLVLYDPSASFLATEVWMEPCLSEFPNENTSLIEELVDNVFRKDMELLMALYLFTLQSTAGTHISDFPLRSKRHEAVKTVLYGPSLFSQSKISFLGFSLPGGDVSLPFEKLPSSMTLPLDYFNISVPFDKQAPSNFDASTLNRALFDFFKSDLSTHAACQFYIPPRQSTNVSASSDLPYLIPSLWNCQLFLFPIDSTLLIIFALSLDVDSFKDSFLGMLLEFQKPSLDVKSEYFPRSKLGMVRADALPPSTAYQTQLRRDGEVIFKMAVTAKKGLSDIYENLINHAGATPRKQLPDSTEINSEVIRSCYSRSLAKSLYFAAIKGASIKSFDLSRSLIGFQRTNFTHDMSNYLYLYTRLDPSSDELDEHNALYRAIILDAFEPLSPLLQGEDSSSNLFFLKYREEKAEWEAANTPLLVRIYAHMTGNRDETIDCSEKLPLDCDLYRGEALDLSIPLSGRNHIELNFEFFTIDGLEELGSFAKTAISDLQRKISILIEDEVFKTLLVLPHNDFSLSTVSYIEDLFMARLADCSMLDSIDQAVSLEQNLVCLRFDLELIHSECGNFLREDLHSFECLESPIRKCNEFYYSFNKGASCFWITFTIFDNFVELHLYCESQKAELRRNILSSAKGSFAKCAQRANQRFLLQELIETHVARDSVDQKYVCYQSFRSDYVLFELGCAVQLTKFFAVHWRLRPSSALNSIMSSLQALAIVNRRNCLIFSKSVYMIFEAPTEEEKHSSKMDIFDTPTRSMKEKDSSEGKSWGVILKVFGIDTPSIDITNDFSKLIEAKLDGLTQQTLAAFIARNPVSKLNKADFEYLMPVNKPPQYSSTYLLVKEMENPHLFLILLRQAFLLFLSPCFGNEISSVLLQHYLAQYGKEVAEEIDTTLPNVLNLGNLSFLYNSISRRQLTQLESKVGFGTACICLTPFDQVNNILFPSRASNSLGTKYAVELDNNEFQVKECSNDEFIRDWPGYKVAVSVWSKGGIRLDPLKERIEMAFQCTLVDYAIESYYRSSKWHSVDTRKLLPDLVQEENLDRQSTVSEEAIGAHLNQVLSILPEVLQTGARRMNPVLQSIKISSSLPLDTIALGFRGVLSDESLQALFFVKDENSNNFKLLEKMLNKAESVSGGRDYVIIGASDIFSDPLDSQKPTNASEVLGPIGSPRLPERFRRKVSIDSLPDNEADVSKERMLQKSNDDMEEVFMFPFYPTFPIYGKRSSFFVVALSGELIHVSTYNWKKTESDKFFLKVIKILNWAKINSQFMIRKAWYSQAQFSKFNAVVSGFGEKAYSSSWSGKMPKLNFTATFASKFRELDFIYHIGGYDATQLQTQIVDYLELFFKFGFRKGKQVSSSTPLSLQEMSKVLQSLTLIHSSSSPIFFSDCCSDLLSKWQRLMETQTINAENLLNLGKSILANASTTKKGDFSGEEIWFKEMLSQFVDRYVQYLESLGMTRSIINLKIQDSNQYGGTFALNSKVLIEAPSIFMERVFSFGVILLQIGFYSYFASANVLSFNYSASSDPDARNGYEMEKECQKMKSHTHIVSFLYDFHLSYIQDILDCGASKFHEVDFVKILRHFVYLNPRKARFARNRIIHGYYDWNQESSDLFRFIVKNPSHSFQPVFYKEKSIAISLTTDQLTNRKDKSPSAHSSSLKYTLLLCEEVEGDSKRLEYFILVIDTAHAFPHGELNEIPEMSTQLDVDPLKEYLEGGYYLSDVLKAFEKVIETLIEKGLKDFGRDNLWTQLRDDQVQDSAEWTSLFLEKIAPQMNDITLYEGPLRFLLSSRLPWQEILGYLSLLYRKHIRVLNNSSDTSMTHFILFNPKNQAFLLYFRISTDVDSQDKHMDLFGVSREGVRDPIEYQHVNEVVDAILHYLWHI